MDRSESRRRFISGSVGLFVSLSLHALLFVMFFPADSTDRQEEPNKELHLELVREEESGDREQEKPAITGPGFTGSPLPGALGKKVKGSGLFNEKKVRRVRIADSAVDAQAREVLKQIKKKIIPIWQQAAPPALGWVRLKMEVSKSGTLRALSITGFQGPPELGAYVLDMLQKISFASIAKTQKLQTPMVIECFFDVTGQSRKD